MRAVPPTRRAPRVFREHSAREGRRCRRLGSSPPIGAAAPPLGRLAQLARAPPLQGGGRGFESLSAHHVRHFETAGQHGSRWSGCGRASRSSAFCRGLAHLGSYCHLGSRSVDGTASVPASVLNGSSVACCRNADLDMPLVDEGALAAYAAAIKDEGDTVPFWVSGRVGGAQRCSILWTCVRTEGPARWPRQACRAPVGGIAIMPNGCDGSWAGCAARARGGCSAVAWLDSRVVMSSRFARGFVCGGFVPGWVWAFLLLWLVATVVLCSSLGGFPVYRLVGGLWFLGLRRVVWGFGWGLGWWLLLGLLIVGLPVSPRGRSPGWSDLLRARRKPTRMTNSELIAAQHAGSPNRVERLRAGGWVWGKPARRVPLGRHASVIRDDLGWISIKRTV